MEDAKFIGDKKEGSVQKYYGQRNQRECLKLTIDGINIERSRYPGKASNFLVDQDPFMQTLIVVLLRRRNLSAGITNLCLERVLNRKCGEIAL